MKLATCLAIFVAICFFSNVSAQYLSNDQTVCVVPSYMSEENFSESNIQNLITQWQRGLQVEASFYAADTDPLKFQLCSPTPSLEKMRLKTCTSNAYECYENVKVDPKTLLLNEDKLPKFVVTEHEGSKFSHILTLFTPEATDFYLTEYELSKLSNVVGPLNERTWKQGEYGLYKINPSFMVVSLNK